MGRATCSGHPSLPVSKTVLLTSTIQTPSGRNTAEFWVCFGLGVFCCCYKCMLDFNYLPSHLGMVLALSFQLISATTKAGNFFLLWFCFFFFKQKTSLSLTHSTEGNGALRKPPNMARLRVKELLEDLLIPRGTGVFSFALAWCISENYSSPSSKTVPDGMEFIT